VVRNPGVLPACKAEADVILRVRGIVQGVGFRPFVHRVATRFGLRGWVRNDAQGVTIRATGTADAVEALVRVLGSEAPPAARVLSVEILERLSPAPVGTARGRNPQGVSRRAAHGRVGDPSLPEIPPDEFSILPSETNAAAIETAAPPDLALCDDCHRELLDPADRRFRYPFINCTRCGPRYSIVERLPYDRPRTTMRSFRMCPKCQAEYEDPSDRRFHAQPNACPNCGPRAVLTETTGAEQTGERAIRRAVALLAKGGILAVKGVGGYHLMVDAADEAAVAELRRRKHREEKPLAVMFPDLGAIAAAAELPPGAEALLTSPAAPIVLLARRPGAALAGAIAPGNPWVGAILPYAPLHVLLLGALGRPMVATSANLSEEPLCADENEAHRRLAGIADAFLDHNRRIAHPVDDSVVRFSRAGPVRLRRARGYAPAPLTLPGRLEGCWLCAGAQAKAAIAVAADDRLTVSPHIGDLDSAATREAYRRTVETLGALYGSDFTAVACDKHPDYASTRFAEETALPRVAVQHHLAHVLSCLLENGRAADDVLGVAWDGTGYGEDGTIWGGEFLLLRGSKASRFARLRPFRLAGGEAAIRDGRRTALGLAHAADDPRFDEIASRLGIGPEEAGAFRVMLTRGLNSPVTTSVGRLFDAVGALLGLGGINRFEGQTPLAVEAAATSARRCGGALALPLRRLAPGSGAVFELDWQPVLDSLPAGSCASESAAAFHRGLAHAIAAVAREAGAGTVALSGGCFQNALLLDLAGEALRSDGFAVLTHRELPPNDGGICAGQALGALWNLTSVGLP
jgi:hydrogenase maturation protein HypF